MRGGRRKKGDSLVHPVPPKRLPREYVDLQSRRSLRKDEGVNLDMPLQDPRKSALLLLGWLAEMDGASRVDRPICEVASVREEGGRGARTDRGIERRCRSGTATCGR